MKTLKTLVILCIAFSISEATRLKDFTDSIPAGKWAAFQNNITDPMIRSSSGYCFAFGNEALWDSTGKHLFFMGAAHGSSITSALMYDASVDNWRNIPTPREPATATTRLGHVYDQQTLIPDSGIYYTVTYTTPKQYFYKYTFATEKWDSLPIPTPIAAGDTAPTLLGRYGYAGSMNYFPDNHTFFMFAHQYGNSYALQFDPTLTPQKWVGYGGSVSSIGFYHSIQDYNSLTREMMILSDAGAQIMNAAKVCRKIKVPPFGGHSCYTKLAHDPVTGTYLAAVFPPIFPTSRLYAYEPDEDEWQEVATGDSAMFNSNSEAAIFRIDEYKAIGIVRGAVPRVLLYKYTTLRDTLPMVSLHTFISDTTVEEFLRSRLTVLAERQDGSRDTVTTTCFYKSLDTNIAVVERGGYVRPIKPGSVRIEIRKHTAVSYVKDTVTLNVVPSSATLDSIRVTPRRLFMMTGDKYRLTLTAYFQKAGERFSRVFLDTGDVWSSMSPLVASVVKNEVMALDTAQSVKIGAVFRDKSDTVTLTIRQNPSFLRRINFQPQANTARFFNWYVDQGAAYSVSQGYGWVGSASRDGRTRSTPANFLQQTFIVPSAATQYRIDAPDGRYVIKIAMGDREWGSGTFWTAQETDTLYSLPGNQNGIRIDTVTVTGGSGLLLNTFGDMAYMILKSDDGTDMNTVAFDNDSELVPVSPVVTGGSPVEPGFLTERSNYQGAALVAAPNPFNPSTVLHYSLGRSDRSVLGIYDVRGALVRSFALQNRQGSVAWDGKDLSGRGVGSGLYFGRLTTNDNKGVTLPLFLMK